MDERQGAALLHLDEAHRLLAVDHAADVVGVVVDEAAQSQRAEIGDVDRNWTGGLAPFTMGNSTTSSSLYSNWWKWWYEGIYRANLGLKFVLYEKIPQYFEGTDINCRFCMEFQIFKDGFYQGIAYNSVHGLQHGLLER